MIFKKQIENMHPPPSRKVDSELPTLSKDERDTLESTVWPFVFVKISAQCLCFKLHISSYAEDIFYNLF